MQACRLLRAITDQGVQKAVLVYPTRLDPIVWSPDFLDRFFRPEFTDLVTPYFYPVGTTVIGEARETDDVTLIYPKGYINAHTVRLFEAEIQRAMQQGRFKIVVCAAELVYIASAGLGAIMGAIEEIRANGGDLRIAELNETVRNIFEILGFNHLYRIYPTEMDAVVSFRGGAETGRTRA